MQTIPYLPPPPSTGNWLISETKNSITSAPRVPPCRKKVFKQDCTPKSNMEPEDEHLKKEIPNLETIRFQVPCLSFWGRTVPINSIIHHSLLVTAPISISGEEQILYSITKCSNQILRTSIRELWHASLDTNTQMIQMITHSTWGYIKKSQAIHFTLIFFAIIGDAAFFLCLEPMETCQLRPESLGKHLKAALLTNIGFWKKTQHLI